jgi:hypothetical protein
VLFEVAAQRQERHLTFSSRDFFDHYYKQALARVSDRRGSERLLYKLARLLFDAGVERIRAQDLLEEVPDARNALDELDHFQVIEVTRRAGDEFVAFYFSLLRDYLLVFHVLRWHELSRDALAAELEDLGEADIHAEAVAFFYRYTDPERKRLLDAPYFSIAQEFRTLYDQILRDDLPSLRPQFSPYTTGEIGFVGELIVRRRQMGLYGFRRRDQGEDEVLLVPSVRYGQNKNLAYVYGAMGLHSSTDFVEPERARKEVLRVEIGRHLQEIVDQGLLDESCCPELASEVIAVEVARDRAIFSDRRHAASAGPIFPLSLLDVRRWQNYELLYHYFEDLQVLAKRRSGEIQEEWRENGTVSLSPDLTWQDRELVRREVEAHLNESDEQVRSRLRWSFYDERARFDRRLLAALASLEAAGIRVLEGHPFPEAKDLASRFWQPNQVSTGELSHFIEELLSYALPLVRRLIEHNFPTMIQEFTTVTQAPFTAVAEINCNVEPGFSSVTLYICDPDAGQEDIKIIAREHEEVRTEIIRGPSFRFMVCCEGVWRQRRDVRGLVGQRHFNVPSLFHPGHDYLGYRTNFKQAGEVEPVIRAVVYDWIRKELVDAFRGLCDKYGVRARESDWTLFARSRN